MMDDYTLANTITSENTMLISECEAYDYNGNRGEEEQEVTESYGDEDGSVDNDGFSMVESMIGRYADTTETLTFEEFKSRMNELNAQWEEILGSTLLESETLLYNQRKELQQKFDQETQAVKRNAKEEIENAWEIADANEKMLQEVQMKVDENMVSIKSETEQRIQAMQKQMEMEKDDAIKEVLKKERARFEEEKKILFLDLNGDHSGASQNLEQVLNEFRETAEKEKEEAIEYIKKETEISFENKLSKYKDELHMQIQKLKANHRLEIKRLRRNSQEQGIRSSDLKKELEEEKEKAVVEAESKLKENLLLEHKKEMDLLKKSNSKSLETVTQRFERRLRNLQTDHSSELQRLNDKFLSEKEKIVKDHKKQLEIMEEEKENILSDVATLSSEINMLREKESERIEELRLNLSAHVTKLISNHETEVRNLKKEHTNQLEQRENEFRELIEKFQQERDSAITDANERVQLVEEEFKSAEEKLHQSYELAVSQKEQELNALKKHYDTIDNQSFESSDETWKQKFMDANDFFEKKAAEEKANYEKTLSELEETLQKEKTKAIEEALKKAATNEDGTALTTATDVEALIEINFESGKLIDILTMEVEQLKKDNDELMCEVTKVNPKSNILKLLNERSTLNTQLADLKATNHVSNIPPSLPDTPLNHSSNATDRPGKNNQFEFLSPMTVATSSPVKIDSTNLNEGKVYKNMHDQQSSLEIKPKKKESVPKNSTQKDVIKTKVQTLNRSNKIDHQSKQNQKANEKRLNGTIIDPREIRLHVLNVPMTERIKKMAAVLNLEIEDDVTKATHVIAGDSEHSIRRTPKLMVALCLTPNIISLDWLNDSFKQKSILGCSRHMLLHDDIAESNYSFSMKTTLREGKQRRLEGGLLAGWSVLFCQAVAGNKAPKEEELRMIVNAAGGTFIDHNDLPLAEDGDRAHVLVITSDPPLPHQTGNPITKAVADVGAGFFSTTWLFRCIMQQKLTGIRRGLGKH